MPLVEVKEIEYDRVLLVSNIYLSLSIKMWEQNETITYHLVLLSQSYIYQFVLLPIESIASDRPRK